MYDLSRLSNDNCLVLVTDILSRKFLNIGKNLFPVCTKIKKKNKIKWWEKEGKKQKNSQLFVLHVNAMKT